MIDLGIAGIGPAELIGGGASASVYAATRRAFGDRVAVKVLRQTLVDAVSRDHFEREAHALRQLADIPGVVGVLDSGVSEEGEPFLIFPLFERSVDEELEQNGPMDPLRAARIMAGVARAVHEGHLRGVIHRDIKPANVLLTNADVGFISDFGIAKLADSTSSMGIGLTPMYASPETMQGEDAGVAGDVYSLGATLATLVLGQPPFVAGETEPLLAVMVRVINDPPPRLESIGAPPEIANIVDRALAKEPSDRQSSAQEIAEELEYVLAGQGLDPGDATHPPDAYSGPLGPPTKQSNPHTGQATEVPANRRNKLPLLLGAAVVLAAVIASILALASNEPVPVAAPRPTPAERTESAPTPTSPLPAPTPPASPPAEPTPLPDAPAPAGLIEVAADGSGEVADLARAVRIAEAGSVIRLGPGRHVLTGIITVEKDISIVGSGMDQTFLVTEGLRAIEFFETPGELRDLTVTSVVEESDRVDALVLFRQSQDARIDNVRISDAPGTGATLHDSQGRITNSHFERSGRSGLIVFDGSNVEIARSSATDNGESGFSISESVVSLFSNVATGHTSENIGFGFIAAGGEVRLIANRSIANRFGFSFTEGALFESYGNLTRDNLTVGYGWLGSGGGVAIANSASNERIGFGVFDSMPILIGNTSVGARSRGFGWQDESSTGLAAGNRADNSLAEGFLVQSPARPEMRSNFGFGNGGAGLITFEDPQAASPAATAGAVVEADGSGNVPDLATAVESADDGDVIRLGSGEFVLTETLVISKDLTIIGDAFGATTLSNSSSHQVIRVEAGTVNLLNLTVTSHPDAGDGDAGAAGAAAAISIVDSAEFVVDQVIVTAVRGNGFEVTGSVGSISNSSFVNNGGSGLVALSDAEVTLVGNTFRENGLAGALFAANSSGTVAANESSGNVGAGFRTEGSARPTLLANIAESNGSGAFEVLESSAPVLIGNSPPT